MPKRMRESRHVEALFEKASVAAKPCLRWDWPACLSRWQAARAPQPAKRRRIHRRPRRVMKPFSARRKSPTSAWRRFMSSTRKMPEHPRSPNIKDWPLVVVAEAVVAAEVAEFAEAAVAALAAPRLSTPAVGDVAAQLAAAPVDVEASFLEAASVALPAEVAEAVPDHA